MGLLINTNLNNIANQARQLSMVNNNMAANQKINMITDKQLNNIAQAQMSAGVAQGIQAVQQFQSVNSVVNAGQSLGYSGRTIPIYSVGSPDCDPTAAASLRYNTVPIYSIRIRLMEQYGDFTAAMKAKLQLQSQTISNNSLASAASVIDKGERGNSIQADIASQNKIVNANAAINTYTATSKLTTQQPASVLSLMR